MCQVHLLLKQKVFLIIFKFLKNQNKFFVDLTIMRNQSFSCITKPDIRKDWKMLKITKVIKTIFLSIAPEQEVCVQRRTKTWQEEKILYDIRHTIIVNATGWICLSWVSAIKKLCCRFDLIFNLKPSYILYESCVKMNKPFLLKLPS